MGLLVQVAPVKVTPSRMPQPTDQDCAPAQSSPHRLILDGLIVNISSCAARHARVGQSIYAASKAGKSLLFCVLIFLCMHAYQCRLND